MSGGDEIGCGIGVLEGGALIGLATEVTGVAIVDVTSDVIVDAASVIVDGLAAMNGSMPDTVPVLETVLAKDVRDIVAAVLEVGNVADCVTAVDVLAIRLLLLVLLEELDVEELRTALGTVEVALLDTEVRGERMLLNTFSIGTNIFAMLRSRRPRGNHRLVWTGNTEGNTCEGPGQTEKLTSTQPDRDKVDRIQQDAG